jgi:hypothetical protein
MGRPTRMPKVLSLILSFFSLEVNNGPSYNIIEYRLIWRAPAYCIK